MSPGLYASAAVLMLCAATTFSQQVFATQTFSDFINQSWYVYVNVTNNTVASNKSVQVVSSLSTQPDNFTVAASIVFNESLLDLGWDYMMVTTNADNFSLQEQYYYAGIAEGYVAYDKMRLIYNQNSYALNVDTEKWIDQHISYMNHMTLTQQNSNFWSRVEAQIEQLWGLSEGFTMRATERNETGLSFRDVFLMNFAVEYGDVEIAVHNDSSSIFESMPPSRRRRQSTGDQHCSALVKVTKNDLFFAHDTWDGYANTIRVFKTYAFDTTVTFSAMAGMISSGDDWYMTSNNLATQETTTEFYNNSLANMILPTSVSEFLRVMTANYVASSAPEWVELFQYNNSGTYCNQWMVLDYNKYAAGATGDQLEDDLFWVAEQIPGNVTARDMTQVLRNTSYWASYNIPYFENIFNLSGFGTEEDKFGNFFSFENTPRAEIFRRNQINVTDLGSMQDIMRYNRWEVDPLSAIPNCPLCKPRNSPMLAIASRADLVPPDASLPSNRSYARYFNISAFGAVDCKITSSSLISNNMQAVVISGPTTYDGLEVFAWDKWRDGVKPAGVPPMYNFSWVSFNVLFTPVPIPPHNFFADVADTTTVVLVCLGCGALLSAIAAVVIFRYKPKQAEDYKAMH